MCFDIACFFLVSIHAAQRTLRVYCNWRSFNHEIHKTHENKTSGENGMGIIVSLAEVSEVVLIRDRFLRVFRGEEM